MCVHTCMCAYVLHVFVYCSCLFVSLCVCVHMCSIVHTLFLKYMQGGSPGYFRNLVTLQCYVF